jgi:hypothetical protein
MKNKKTNTMDQNNVSQIAAHIFGNPVKAAGTICLELDEAPGATPEFRLQIVSEILMQLLFEGIKVRFGAAARPETLNEQQIAVLTDYTRSYGYGMIVRTSHLSDAPVVAEASVSGVGILPSKCELQDYCERFYNYDLGTWHEVAFIQLKIHRK